MKIGIIQHAVQTADLSANLRNMVQSYRDCIDRGAQLVIAHAFALSGLEIKDLKNRLSYQKQAEKALSLLAQEISSVPLILASYANPLDTLDLDIFSEGDESISLSDDETSVESPAILVPFLLEAGLVSQLDDMDVNEILGLNIAVVLGDESYLPSEDKIDLFVRLSTKPWSLDSTESLDEDRVWDADVNNCPAITVVPFGYAEQQYYAGGSCLYLEKVGASHRLPYFQAAQAVVDTNQPARALALPAPEECLRQAIVQSLREYVQQFNYTGICLNLDLPYSRLLTLLCVEAIGSSKVFGISFSNGDFQPESSLGIGLVSLRSLAADAMLGQQAILNNEALDSYYARMQAALLNCYAEQEGLMLVSPLNRHQILLGEYTLYAEPCAKILPFGQLFESHLYTLSKYLSEGQLDYFGVLCEPLRPEIDRILQITQNENTGSTSLLESEGELFEENDVRFVQRRVMASAEMAAQLPPCFKLDASIEKASYPVAHRLND